MPKGNGKPIPQVEVKKDLTEEQSKKLLATLKERFEKNMQRHQGIEWNKIEVKLQDNIKKLESLNAMEFTGGEPDVVGFDEKTGEYIFYDCSPESPNGRRSTCFDGEGEQERLKQGINPAGNALDIAAAIGIKILSEEEYRELQKLGEFDLKTSSWIETPTDIRRLGGALFCDRRYDTVFKYHNGAGSFYGARGFRGKLLV